MREPAPPIPTIAQLDLPQHGVTHVNVWCEGCHHQAKVPVDDIDGRLTILQFAAKLRCSACGGTSCTAMPSWPGGRGPGGAHSFGPIGAAPVAESRDAVDEELVVAGADRGSG